MNQIVEQAQTFAKSKINGLTLFSLLGGAFGLIGGIKMTKALYEESAKIFNDKKMIAKATGKMLACALACSIPFKH